MSMRHIEGKDGLEPYLNGRDRVKAGLAQSIVSLTSTWRELYGDIPLPGQATEPTAIPDGSSEALPFRLEPIPFEIEIPTVSEEVYAETRKAVEATGAFIAPIRAVSIEDLLEEDKQRGQRRFNHNQVDSSKTMRTTVPPEMEAFINPDAVRIEGSNWLSTDEQKTKIAEEAVSFRQQLPEAVRAFVNLHMVDPSTMSQLEDAWMDAGKGLLLPDFFARTDVQTVPGLVAHVGRGDPSYGRLVFDWYRGHGLGGVFAVPVGVLPRKLTA